MTTAASLLTNCCTTAGEQERLLHKMTHADMLLTGTLGTGNDGVGGPFVANMNRLPPLPWILWCAGVARQGLVQPET